LIPKSAMVTSLLIAVMLASMPYAIVAGQSTSTISGTVRCGGGCDTVGLLYGEPIDVAGHILAWMDVALDPYTGQPRPDLPTTNAQTSFDATARGRYELQGVEPGIYDLYAGTGVGPENAFPMILAVSKLTVHANQNLSIDLYVCSSSGFVNGVCPHYQNPSTSTTQVSLTPSTTYSYSTTSNVLTSFTPYTYSSTSSAVTSPLQMPQPPSSGSVSPFLTAIEIGIIALIIAGTVFAYVYGGKSPSKSRGPSQMQSSTLREASLGKQFCLGCGNELPLGSKFCNKCGTRQV